MRVNGKAKFSHTYLRKLGILDTCLMLAPSSPICVSIYLMFSWKFGSDLGETTPGLISAEPG
jgi:hypothetical protein